MEFVLLDKYSDEWEKAWAWLAEHPINSELENPSVALNDNEAWQYIGSYKQGNRLISTFRHRNHPLTGGIYNLSYSHDGFTIDQIKRQIKL